MWVGTGMAMAEMEEAATLKSGGSKGLLVAMGPWAGGGDQTDEERLASATFRDDGPLRPLFC